MRLEDFSHAHRSSKSSRSNGTETALTLKKRMLVSQLISDTSGRLNIGRPMIEVDEIDDLISLNCVSTLQWIPLLDTGEILVAANGHCSSFRYSTDLQEFLRSLAEGNRVDVSKLQAVDPRESETLSVVTALACWGAI